MPPLPDPDLGPVLLEQKIKKGQIGNLVFLAIVGLPFLLVPLVPAAPLEVKLGLGLFGLGLIAFVGIMAWRHWMHVFLQERGICEYRQGKLRSLRYDQVATLFYTSGRIFTHGSYVHTVQKLALQADESEPKPLVCTHIFREPDGRAPGEARTPLTEVRDQVSRRLADRLLERLKAGESLTWGPDIRVSLRGLETGNRDGREELVEWPRIRHCGLKEGTYQLWIDGDENPRLKISSALPNFFPTAALVQRLRQEVAQ